MAWTIKLDRSAERELDKLDRQVARRILAFLYSRVATLDNPRSIGKALKGLTQGDLWRYRVGDYRVVVRIQDAEMVVLVLRARHRRKVYRLR